MLFRSIFRGWKTNRAALNDEVKARIQYAISSQKVIPKYGLQTPEFSKFVFLVPACFLLGITTVPISPLLFERVIPYHIRTVAFSMSFFALVDLAVSVVGRPSITSHRWVPVVGTLAYAWTSLLIGTAVVVTSDANPRAGYKASLAAIAVHAVPACMLPMPSWVRMWRLSLLVLSGASIVSAWKQLNFLETNWHQLIHED